MPTTPQDTAALESTVRRMVEAGEPETDIALVIQHWGELGPGAAPRDPTILERAFSPVPPIQRGARSLANLIEGVDRPAPDTQPLDLGTTIREAGESVRADPMGAVHGLDTMLAEMTGVPAIQRFGREAMETVPALIDQPAATLRGLGAGLVESVGSITPADVLALVGLRSGARAAHRPKPKPITDPRRLLPEIASPAGDPVGARVAVQEAADRAGAGLARGRGARPAPGPLSPRLAPRRSAQATPNVPAPTPPSAVSLPPTPARGPGIVTMSPAARRAGASLSDTTEQLARQRVQAQAAGGAVSPAVRAARESIDEMIDQGFSRAAAEQAVVRGLRGSERRTVQEALDRGRPGRPAAPPAPAQVERAIAEVPEAGPALQQAAQAGTLRTVGTGEVDDLLRQADDLATAFRDKPDATTMADLRRIVGSRQASRMTGVPQAQIRELGPSRRPLIAERRTMDAHFRRLIRDQEGFSQPELLAALSGAGLGGAVAAGDAETLEDAIAQGLSGAMIGGLIGVGATRGARKIGEFRRGGQSAQERAKRLFEVGDTANLLASPAMVKSSLGSLGGVGLAINEQALAGNRMAALRGVRALPTMVDDWTRVMRMSDQQFIKLRNEISPHLARTLGTRSGTRLERLANYISRPFAASDYAGRRALMKMGLSQNEAATYMLVSQPTSVLGNETVDFINKWWMLRMAAKFPRVRVNMLERGKEYSPLGLSGRLRRTAHGAEQVPPALQRARAAIGTGLTGGGFLYGLEREPGFGEASIVSSMAGPAALPVGIGIASGRAAAQGRSALAEALNELIQAAPRFTETAQRVEQRLIPGRPAWQALRNLGVVAGPHPVERELER